MDCKNAKTKIYQANWSNLIAINNIKNESLCNLTKLSHAKLCSTNFERQKFTLELIFFNEKAATFLVWKDCNDTAMFVKTVIINVKSKNCINVKSKNAWFKLNYKNRKIENESKKQQFNTWVL